MQSNDLERTFESSRPRLRRVAHRILNDWDEAEDAVQETWLKAARSPSQEVLNAGAWLTAIVTRASLDRLRRRRRYAVGPFEPDLGANDLANAVDPADNPEQATMKADQVGVALLAV